MSGIVGPAGLARQATSPVIVPAPFFVWTTVAGTWQVAESTSYYGGIVYSNSTADAVNDEIYTSIYLGAGNYTITAVFYQDTDCGKFQIKIDDVVKATIDGYSTPASMYVDSTTTGVAISGGYHKLGIKVSAKHASSSAYECFLHSLIFQRTS